MNPADERSCWNKRWTRERNTREASKLQHFLTLLLPSIENLNPLPRSSFLPRNETRSNENPPPPPPYFAFTIYPQIPRRLENRPRLPLILPRARISFEIHRVSTTERKRLASRRGATRRGKDKVQPRYLSIGANNILI